MARSKTHTILSIAFAAVGAGSLLVFHIQIAASQSRLPDLVVSNASLAKDEAGTFAGKLTITVTNRGNAAAGASYVMATFKQSPATEAKPVYYVGQVVKPLRVGEGATEVFDLKGKKLGTGVFVLVQVDPYNQVRETNEDNNALLLKP